jgi:hypothetical protein
MPVAVILRGRSDGRFIRAQPIPPYRYWWEAGSVPVRTKHAQAIFRGEQWTIGRLKCVPGDYAPKDRA